jgi:hypothetical protein
VNGTLDQYLVAVDRWKSEVQSELDALPVEDQRARLLAVRRQIEKSLDCQFPKLPATQASK